LPPDSLSAAAWRDFGERAENSGAWLTARDAFAAVHAWRPSADAAVRAGHAALNGNNPESALEFATAAGALEDSTQAAQSSVPLRVRALTLLARPAEAEALVAAFEEWLPADVRISLLRAVALGWVRAGDVTKARTALASAGTEDDDPAAGWIALYEGDLTTARRVMRGSSDLAPGGVTALAILARTAALRSPILGRAFLALARGDSTEAGRYLVQAADSLPDAASLLLATAAHIDAARRNDSGAIALWSTILERHAASPEAAEADLLWARLLRRSGDSAGAIARLEHLILNYPTSALVPQARRELELARGGIPSTS
jgi:tetratricopeptide (TPR) repeat protein